MLGGTMSYLYRLTEWIAKLAVLNILWVGFSLLGFLIFGIGPATAAMFAVEKEWMNGRTDNPLLKKFWTVYKKEFIKGNVLAMTFIIIGWLLYEDFQFTLLLSGSQHMILLISTSIVFLSYLLTLIYIFPIFSYFEFSKLRQYFKQAFLLGLTQLPSTLLILSGAGVLFIVFKFVPALMIFYFASLISVHITIITHRIFNKVIGGVSP